MRRLSPAESPLRRTTCAVVSQWSERASPRSSFNALRNSAFGLFQCEVQVLPSLRRVIALIAFKCAEQLLKKPRLEPDVEIAKLLNVCFQGHVRSFKNSLHFTTS